MRGASPVIPEAITPDLVPTYTLISRHSADCPDKSKGREYTHCGCRKHIAVYDPRIQDIKKRQSLIPTKTRSWQEAERIVQAYRDQHNPDKVEAARARAEVEALKNQQRAENAVATIEEAVYRFLTFKQDNPSRRSSRIAGKTADSTMIAYKNLLGDVVLINQKFEVRRKGRLFSWLDTLNPRPVYITDLTHTLVDAFRATWDFPSDLTMATAFTRLKTFFVYCQIRGRWIKSNPLDGVTRPTIQDGSRTMAFSDEQYSAIIATLGKREANLRSAETAENRLETRKQLEENRRLLALIELGRWGGLTLHDSVDFKLDALNGDELRYRRKKTNKVAKPILPPHVVEFLRTVVPINGDLNQPFRNKDKYTDIKSDKHWWSDQFKELCTEAGIKSIKTDIREREPHFHMLRDTFAVGQLERNIRDGKPSLKSIADAMGDSIQVMLKHYAPVIDKLEKAHAEEQRKVVAAQVEAMNKQPAEPKVVEIGGRK
jgi:integrase